MDSLFLSCCHLVMRVFVVVNRKREGGFMLILGGDTGSWAARWQATYMGYVPKGSLFSFFQRMGMTKWRWFGGIVSEKQGLYCMMGGWA